MINMINMFEFRNGCFWSLFLFVILQRFIGFSMSLNKMISFEKDS
jgi:hypothetical protein